MEDNDLKQILQIYNRGGMGTGYFKTRSNIVFPEKPNHLGIYIGTVEKVNSKNKLVTISLKEKIKMGDIISINDETSYISQIIDNNTVGEIKDTKNIKIGDKVYRIVDNVLNKSQWEVYKKEIRKIDISSKLYDDDKNIYLELFNDKIYTKTTLEKQNWTANELEESRILCQIQKTGGTIFNIKNVEIKVNNLRLPISQLNNLRREALESFEQELERSITRKYDKKIDIDFESKNFIKQINPKLNLYLTKFDKNINYSEFDYNQIYIQFKDLVECDNIKNCIAVLPTIIDENYEKFIEKNIDVFNKVEAVAITHLSQIEFLKKLNINKKIVADYSLNITNNLSEKVLEKIGIERFTMSPELDKKDINSFSSNLKKEYVVYGRICLMTSKYCPIGKNGNCNQICKSGDFELKDRRNFKFPIVTDRINCHTKIYNSQILSREYNNLNIDFIRIDIFDETEEQIKQIIKSKQNNII